mmetsp:Transcript_2899/g.4408  ORF Transcript_2899/g.4408 Transcript_2899/m.4408 type:complete len:272 (-) Transcript_2899:177-992(-)
MLFFVIIFSFLSKICESRVMVWMCLEFCGDESSDASMQLDQISHHTNVVSAVSFEKYTLGPNVTLVDNNLTMVSDEIIAMGLEAWPLLSSYPHPPEFMDWMREAFANPEPFIDQCVSEAEKYGYTGYNLDWEPTDDVTEEDGTAYAQFIEDLAEGLHKHNLKLTVDIATWSPIWNYDAMATTTADTFISMGTYTSTDSSFTTQLDLLVDAFGPTRSGVGLETVNASTGERIPLNEVQWRFKSIKESGVSEVDLWRAPVPPLWWPIIEEYLL